MRRITLVLGLLLLGVGYLAYAQNTTADKAEPKLKAPPGFKAKPGTVAEPGGTGWAKEIVHEKTGIEMVFIPAGEFMMGSPAGEAGRDGDEVQHRMRITKPFYMGKYHVTRGQFAAFVKDSNYKTDAEKEGWSFAIEGQKFGKVDGVSWVKPGFDQTDAHPVVCVSHNDAAAFCGWIGAQSGSATRLPTESQWEYACRAGTRTAYQWGDNPDDGKGWCNAADQTVKAQFPNATVFFNWADGFVFTSPVGSFKANAFGLYDMHGNAWEWCQDWYGPYESAAGGVVDDPQGPANGALRVLRGGSWLNTPRNCRSGNRLGSSPDLRCFDAGFRLSLDLK